MFINIDINEEDLAKHLEILVISKKIVTTTIQDGQSIADGLGLIEDLINQMAKARDLDKKDAGIPKLADILGLSKGESANELYNIRTPHVDRAVKDGRITGVPG